MDIKEITPRERNFFLVGHIDQEMVGKITTDILGVAAHDAYLSDIFETQFNSEYSPDPITIHIDSYGGELYPALGLVSVMRSVGTQVNTFTMGCAMSAGFIVHLAGRERYCVKNSTFMMHQLSTGPGFAMVDHLRESYEEGTRCQKLVDDFIRETTKITKKRLEENRKSKEDWYIGSAEAKKLGIVDVVIPETEFVESDDEE